MSRQDITGMKFGRLTAISYAGNYNWLCQCECGNQKVIATSSLTRGLTKSCGCLYAETVTKHGFDRRVGKDRFYSIWHSMKSRCTKPNIDCAANYIGRGITICQEWLSFLNFKKDMYESYLEHLKEHGTLNTTIDRIDNNSGYSKDNCRWATKKEQSRNLRLNRLISFNGETHCIAEWAEITGINEKILSYRIKAGWNIEKALTTPVNENMRRSKVKCSN